MRNEKGSFTIEAAVVVPITMVLLLSVVFLTFYLHDLAVLRSVSAYAVLESYTASDFGETVSTGQIEALLERKLIAAGQVTVTANRKENEAYLRSSASFSIPLPLIRMVLDPGSLTLSAQCGISGLNGRKTLLLYKSICDGAAGILNGE